MKLLQINIGDIECTAIVTYYRPSIPAITNLAPEDCNQESPGELEYTLDFSCEDREKIEQQIREQLA